MAEAGHQDLAQELGLRRLGVLAPVLAGAVELGDEHRQAEGGEAFEHRPHLRGGSPAIPVVEMALEADRIQRGVVVEQEADGVRVAVAVLREVADQDVELVDRQAHSP